MTLSEERISIPILISISISTTRYVPISLSVVGIYKQHVCRCVCVRLSPQCIFNGINMNFHYFKSSRTPALKPIGRGIFLAASPPLAILHIDGCSKKVKERVQYV